jgi:hypothetical protein
MKTTRFLALLTSVVGIAACDKAGDNVILAPQPPMAYTRFVNAVADTGRTDWRFIDQLEYSPVMLGMQFRDFSPYQQTAPGQRKLRVFPTSTDINVTQQFLMDVTLTLEAGKYYTIIHHGFSRTGSTPADAILLLEDAIPTVTAGNVAVRAVNLGVGLANQDVYATATSTAPLPATPLFSNIAFLGSSTYATQTTGSLVFRSANTGTTTVTATGTAPAGAAADGTNNLTAVGGSTIEKSVFTGFIFPRSVAGSQAPQTTAFNSPAIVYLVDRHPR